MRVDLVSSTPKRVLIVVANPSISTTLGWPVGFWGAELTHPYFELTERGVDVTIASPDGGKVELDALSDPRDESRWSASDLITMGFVNTPELLALLDNTAKLSDLNVADFDAIMVAGGQSPMFTFRDNAVVADAVRAFYEAEKPVAVYCHGTAALIDLRLSDGSYLVDGKTVTGFEDELRRCGANYVQGGLLKAFAVRDGRLITGQQQYSARAVTQLVIEAMGV